MAPFTAGPSHVRRFSTAVVLALCATLIGQITGPSDLWDQTQPRTIAYTTDMLARGGDAWILAKDAAGLHATKPPLYNWLSAGFVAVLGHYSEIAHKLPSILSMLAIVMLLVRWGEVWRPGLGWLAALAWLACYPTFKLGYLARPDMVLCLVLLLGWHCATQLLLEGSRDGPTPGPMLGGSRRRVIAFWACVILATWTKGLASIVLPFYAVAASFILHRSFAGLARLRPVGGSIAAIVLGLAWYVMAYFVNGGHVERTLMYAELVGRITGTGPEGGSRGPVAILTGALTMPFYFMVRFAPWSITALLGALALLDARGQPADQPGRRWRHVDGGAHLLLAVVWVAIIVIAFSFSSGKRADYIAPVYGPAALVAAWWMLSDRFSPVRRAPWLPPLLATIALTACIVIDLRGPVRRSETMRRFDEIAQRLDQERDPDVTLVVLTPQLPHFAILYSDVAPCENTATKVAALVAQGKRVRVLSADIKMVQATRWALLSGQAVERWNISHTAEACELGYISPLRMIEFNPPPEGRRIDFAYR
ncbi:MAG: hypothetical protein SGJ11_06170 [Phycisphaerae bacterium]|nr:hypothetical protein [Phycisphaerae bacterium]